MTLAYSLFVTPDLFRGPLCRLGMGWKREAARLPTGGPRNESGVTDEGVGGAGNIDFRPYAP